MIQQLSPGTSSIPPSRPAVAGMGDDPEGGPFDEDDSTEIRVFCDKSNVTLTCGSGWWHQKGGNYDLAIVVPVVPVLPLVNEGILEIAAFSGASDLGCN